MGQAIIERLVSAGWKVAAPTRAELDLSNLEAIPGFCASIRSANKEVNAIIHVAGIWHDADSALAGKPFDEFTPEQTAQTMNVGVTAFMLLVNNLLGSKLSHVIGISGTFADGAKGWVPYYVSKRSLEDFIVALSQDQPGLKVYGVSPADTATPAYKRFYPEYASSAQKPDEVAKLVADLLEDRSPYPNGGVIEIRDGKTSSGFHV